MGREIDLLANYPKTPRDLTKRLAEKSEEDRLIARKFEKDFFDGERKHGYGGFRYDPRYWTPVIPDFVHQYSLAPGMKVLDVGCAKGFMLHDFLVAIPELEVKGIDVSEYAIDNAMEDVKPFLQVADAKSLPFADNSFDLVISINTVHNLERVECAIALQEIQRVSKAKSFITVDAYRNPDEKDRMYAWNLTAKTIMPVDEWLSFFDQVGYKGDFFWFIP